MSNKRIYVVVANKINYLVNATSKQQAINHIAKGLVTAKVASQTDLVAHLTAGEKIVEAVETSEPEHFPAVNSADPYPPAGPAVIATGVAA